MHTRMTCQSRAFKRRVVHLRPLPLEVKERVKAKENRKMTSQKKRKRVVPKRQRGKAKIAEKAGEKQSHRSLRLAGLHLSGSSFEDEAPAESATGPYAMRSYSKVGAKREGSVTKFTCGCVLFTRSMEDAETEVDVSLGMLDLVPLHRNPRKQRLAVARKDQLMSRWFLSRR